MMCKYIQTKYKGYDIAKQIETSSSGEIEIKIYPALQKIIKKIDDNPEMIRWRAKEMTVNSSLTKYLLNVVYSGNYLSDKMRNAVYLISSLYYVDNNNLQINYDDYDLYVDIIKKVIKHFAEQLKLFKYSKITSFSINIENKIKKEITKEEIKGVGYNE
ncbi:MAG: hypothetical protein PHD03_04875 [Bacilli bacterium]|nr:hypothetical protein [Bacilli bacterium]